MEARRLPAPGADPVDHHLDILHGIVFWQLRRGKAGFGKADNLPAAQAVEVRMGRMACPCGAESPDPVVCGNPVGQILLDQPFQITVEGNPVNWSPCPSRHPFLDFQMADGMAHLEQNLQDLHTEGGDPFSGGPDALGRVGP